MIFGCKLKMAPCGQGHATLRTRPPKFVLEEEDPIPEFCVINPPYVGLPVLVLDVITIITSYPVCFLHS